MGDIKMRKVKVLVLITAMDRGGAETMVMNYLRNIDREKVQMDFLVIRKYKSDYEDEIKQMGSTVYHLNPIFLKNIGRFKREFRFRREKLFPNENSKKNGCSSENRSRSFNTK